MGHALKFWQPDSGTSSAKCGMPSWRGAIQVFILTKQTHAEGSKEVTAGTNRAELGMRSRRATIQTLSIPSRSMVKAEKM